MRCRNNLKNSEASVTNYVSGVFISSADTSVVFATNGAIASEFRDLESSGWIVTGFMLALCATQPLVSIIDFHANLTQDIFPNVAFQYGKMSDVYGRKLMLCLAYVLFTVGCFVR